MSNGGNGPKMVRFRLAHDDSGHSYAIPVDLFDVFEMWVANEGAGVYNFDLHRIDGRFTFLDPKCE